MWPWLLSRRRRNMRLVAYKPVPNRGYRPEGIFRCRLHAFLRSGNLLSGRGPTKPPYLVYLGRVNSNKGADRAIQVAKRAGLPLKIVGPARDEPGNDVFYREKIAPFLGPDCVHLGEVSNEEKLRVLSGATAMIFPIRWREPMGIVMIESLACGTPVIVSNRASAPELVSHGKTGYLCDGFEDFVAAVNKAGRIDRSECRRTAEMLFDVPRMISEIEKRLRPGRCALSASGGFPVKAMKKTVLHLTPLALCGGCEVNCLRVIQGRGDCAHSVMVFGERGPMSAAWEEAGARVEHLGAWHRGPTRFAAALADWSRTQAAPDAVMYWSTSRLPAVLRALRHWSTPWAVHLGNPLRPGLVSVARRWFQERIYAAPPAITLVACSRHVEASHRQAAYFRRFSTRVIYNPVDPALDRPRRHRLLSPGSAPRIGMVARLDPIKDHLTVIRALAATASVRPDIVVEFAGDGPLREKLMLEARRLNLRDRVRFLGFRPVAPLLAEWDLYVHSTTESEGMGNSPWPRL